MSTIRIIFADLNKQELLMYRQDGSKIIIHQGDPRIAALVDKVFPDMRKQNYCDLPEALLDKSNPFSDTEKKMNGFVRFFKMAKAKFDEIIGNTKEEVKPDLPPQKAGDLSALQSILHPVAPTVKKVVKDQNEPGDQDPLTKSEQAVKEIMAHATPSSDRSFQEESVGTQATVAVLEDGTIIENADKLKVQLEAVNAGLASETGLKNFLNRMASVSRAHSAQDLLTFMEKGELPIADDGTVLVYKRLRSTTAKGVYVDCYSGNVKQKVGSHVFMDASLVDPNRSTECSSGLHVARRDYLTAFSGDICVLAKLAPEDVIAVPHGDPRKLRAKGYHIIAVLSQEDHDRVVRNQPLKDENLLGNAIAGNHVGVLQTVQITQHRGGGVIYTDVAGKAEFVSDESLKSKSLDTLPTEGKVNVDAVAVAKADELFKAEPAGPVSEPLGVAEPVPEPVFTEVAQTKAAPKPANKLYSLLAAYADAEPGSVAEHVAATKLVDFKKSSRKSWTALGVSLDVHSAVVELAAKPSPVEATKPQKKTSKPVKAKPAAAKPAAKKPKAAAKPVVKATRNIGPVTKVTDTPAETVQQLVIRAVKNKSQALALQAFEAKKAKKKSWDALGVAPSDVVTLTKLAGK
ncbi:RIIB lysis inhibitor [Pseudomonas phage Littlefix]|uniref:RIIB-like protein n=1 Tax=Pseudomonas phage Littlefix TaxID=2079289 RepID=A0A2K9VHU4_9CAUD|nr:RIIB lysis inhibitor [Pseudomonas phage Littlefix]AUV61879.1 hypothetical protein PsPhLittlefix_gp64 [Pseudomonas phage Littlefix]